MAEPLWWSIRPAQSARPATYRCPLCGELLHASSPHALIVPEGDVECRRHAHRECVAAARAGGRLRTEDEYAATLPKGPSLVRRLLDRL